MYQTAGLGFSLKPPKWLRDLGAKVIGQTKVSVPTPAGVPITVDMGDPAQVEALRRALLGARFQVGQTQPTFPEFSTAVQSVPGGWATIAVAGGLLAFFLFRGRR